MTIRVLFDRILVLPEQPETITAGGIIIPDAFSKQPVRGKVVSVGPGKKADNYEMQTKVGDTVTFGKYTGMELQHEGVTYLLMPETDVISIL